MKFYSVIGVDVVSGSGHDAWGWAIKLSEYAQRNGPIAEQHEVLQNVVNMVPVNGALGPNSQLS